MISDKIKEQLANKDISVMPSYEGKTMNIEITSNCNERCIYCEYSAQGLHKRNKMIEPELFYKVTKQAKELGIRDIGLYITAEPLCNPKIYNYVEYLKKELKFEYVYISTNGILCTPSNLQKLVYAGIDSIKFSVSATNKEEFILHHGVDCFEQVYENIKYAYSFREKNNLNYKLFIFSILTEININNKQRFIELYGKYVDELLFTNVIANPYIDGVGKYLCIKQGATQLMNIYDSVKLPCLELFDRIVVNEDGYLCACCHETGSKYTEIVDLHNVDLKDAVYCDRLKKIRKLHIEKKVDGLICENCVSGKFINANAMNAKLQNRVMVDPKKNMETEILERIKIYSK